ncbi:(2Fe-2S) ferredoxin domain-containing protein [Chitinophaga sp.]|uniref:(2Fe-2S) ferredoxin domain-containing protein n=1 Tax=Chitinophaga sp. TaxID=1869181 RepID=UPI0031D19246
MAIKDLTKVQKMVFICNGGTCSKGGADENTLALRAHLTQHGMDDEIHTIRTKCMGQCTNGPIVFIHPEGAWYGGVTTEVARDIVTQHLLQNTLLPSQLCFPEAEAMQLQPVTFNAAKAD